MRARVVGRATQQYGTGSAVTGSASLFGAAKPLFGAQPVKDAHVWVSTVKFFRLAI